jgi:hypothetical protein
MSEFKSIENIEKEDFDKFKKELPQIPVKQVSKKEYRALRKLHEIFEDYNLDGIDNYQRMVPRTIHEVRVIQALRKYTDQATNLFCEKSFGRNVIKDLEIIVDSPTEKKKKRFSGKK